MSGWDPGEGHRDTMAFGSEKPPLSPTKKLIAAGAVGLLVGVAIGVFAGGQDELRRLVGAEESTSSSVAEIVPGAVEKTSGVGDHGPEFAVDLFNNADEEVTVTGLDFDGLRGGLTDVHHVAVPPHTWRPVLFSAPPDCFIRAPTTLPTVHVELLGAAGDSEHTVPLPGGGQTLLDYHQAMCGAGSTPTVADLLGIWVLEEAFSSSDLEGVLVMRFGRDGTFTADAEGVMLLDEERGIEGRYWFHRGRLVTDVEGGYGCARGDRALWRATVVEDGASTSSSGETPLMALAWTSGRCPDNGRGMVWLMRRIIDGTDTPGTPG